MLPISVVIVYHCCAGTAKQRFSEDANETMTEITKTKIFIIGVILICLFTALHYGFGLGRGDGDVHKWADIALGFLMATGILMLMPLFLTILEEDNARNGRRAEE